MLESDEAIVLPALRDPTHEGGDGEGIPGAEVVEFLGYLASEMLKAVEILREETQTELAEGDVSSRMRTLNALKSRRRKLESHLRSELADARSIISGLQDEPALARTLEGEVRAVSQTVGRALQGLTDEFEV